MAVLAKNIAPDFAIPRRHMVDNQLRPNGVTDERILAAMEDIPRELFVTSTHVGVAYMDENIRLISDRSLMQPMVLAKLLQAAEIKKGDRVLELAPATGYSTLILAALTSPIFCVEPDALLHDEAEKNVSTYAPGKASVLAGAPVEGCIVHAPFDVIFINGAVEFLPEFLFDQLDEGGRLCAVMRDHDPTGAIHTGQARMYRKSGGEMTYTALFEASAPLAPGFEASQGFVF